ncbi:hypothetical protein WR25_23296 isoform B [Diploscapter pachys]|uniref:FAD dependent oxidoreductase domain-containing protein n=1 Tax=Diploscapter pachys TaxID=2018661 RepID=A0A2A2J7P6_9BILA|nr:hypothetical protein WR25_23296 isoform B [Diploscapter pachys]
MNIKKKTKKNIQYDRIHTQGSSHGKTRIIRRAHAEPEIVELVGHTYEQLKELEAKVGTQLWQNIGFLWVSSEKHINTISEALKIYNLPHEIIPGSKINERFHQFDNFDDSFMGLYDPKGGVIFADRWLAAFQDLFLSMGGKIADHEKVLTYRDGNIVEIHTINGNCYKGKKVIFTVGSWLEQIFPDLPMSVQATSLTVCYWSPKEISDIKHFQVGNVPSFYFMNPSTHFAAFALPERDYMGGLKIANEAQTPLNPNGAHPPIDEKGISDMKRFIKQHMPMINNESPMKIEQCKYTVSPDHKYVIGHLPGSKNILIGGCCSGTGFKVGVKNLRVQENSAVNEVSN